MKSNPPRTAMHTPTHLPLQANSPSDFDFFVGPWKVQHRRLKDRLVGSTEWESFEGRSTMHKVLGGFGNVDDNLLHLPGGDYRAVTLRAYDAQAGTWSIWWLDARTPGALDVPVVGRFENGIGTFLAQDSLNGQAILVRFLWRQDASGQPRWEQAFSPDNGATWETNWVMDFTRLELE